MPPGHSGAAVGKEVTPSHRSLRATSGKRVRSSGRRERALRPSSVSIRCNLGKLAAQEFVRCPGRKFTFVDHG